MAHVLLVESWVGAMGRLLPRAVLEAGHGFSFLTRDPHHYLRDAPAGGGHPLLAARNLLTAETNDVPALLEHVTRLHGAIPFDGVLTSCDYYLETVALLAARLGLPGGDPDAVRTAYRKDLSRQAMDRAGVPQPAFALAEGWTEVSRAADRLGFPLVLKPVDLCAGMYVRRVTDQAELRGAFDAVAGFPVNARRQPRVPAVLLEELLTGPEVSVETVTVDGVTTVIGVTDKSLGGATGFVETGHMFPADLDGAAAEKTAVAALEAVGFDQGVAHTELRLTDDGPKVVEVNPRPAGNQITELVRRVTGIDLPMVYAQLALGETPDLSRADTGVGSAAVAFVLPPRAGTVESIRRWPDDDRIVDWSLCGPGHRAGDASSNNDYLGYVMVVDEKPGAARATAGTLAAEAEVRYAA
ncbi:ATP-grasp domain-containing protein [Actinoplanes sp. NBRC 103695]|uniref:ATP-grasp domain-containing protein n=1 Tax=Actinoplanes sp. NBRC 103695 TaxID=3032202 RepID=UPI0024A5A83B|nr:ATP-grasp domain-containing protein [Actinoplanes sp. NBRC 103695]GLY99006.1 argininosuccinate lyase [Actinoplanes sp. NBRC 103695]